MDADLGGSTNTAGGTQDSSIVDADVSTDLTGEETTIGADIGGGSLVNVESSGETLVDVESSPTIDDILQNAPLTEETDIGAEIDASGSTASTETEVGVEADVDGSVAGEDVASDPADGLSTTTVTTL